MHLSLFLQQNVRVYLRLDSERERRVDNPFDCLLNLLFVIRLQIQVDQLSHYYALHVLELFHELFVLVVLRGSRALVLYLP